MDIQELKARAKELRNLMSSEEAKRQEALTEARDSGKGLTGKLLERYERADGNIHGFSIELDAIERDLTEARSDFLRNVALNQRAQSVAVDADGGATVPEILSATLWDLARNQTVAREAGVSFIPLSGPGETFVLPKITSDAVPAWVGENGLIGEDMLEFGSETLAPKKLALTVRASRELVQDSNQNIGNVIIDAVTKAFAQEIDRVIFNGTGAAEPEGIRNSGIFATAGVGAPDWSALSSAALSITEANYDPSAFVMAPSIKRTLVEQRIDQGGGAGTGMYLPATTDLGAGTDESYILAGDFSQVVVGVRLALDVLPLMERYAEYGQVGWVFSYRMDTTVMRLSAFHSLEEVTV